MFSGFVADVIFDPESTSMFSDARIVKVRVAVAGEFTVAPDSKETLPVACAATALCARKVTLREFNSAFRVVTDKLESVAVATQTPVVPTNLPVVSVEPETTDSTLG